MNEQLKHTPGPWSTGTDEDGHVVYDGEFNVVADTLREDGDAETERANAVLIAAAPDLLSALEAIAALSARTATLLRTPQGRVVTAEGQAKLFESLAERAQSAIAKSVGVIGGGKVQAAALLGDVP